LLQKLLLESDDQDILPRREESILERCWPQHQYPVHKESRGDLRSERERERERKRAGEEERKRGRERREERGEGREGRERKEKEKKRRKTIG